MKAQIISFQCVLKNELGKLISDTYNRDVITQVPFPESESLPGLAKGLEGLQQGEKRTIRLKAREAYGLYDPGLSTTMPLKKLGGGQELNVGDRVNTRDPQGIFAFIALHVLWATLCRSTRIIRLRGKTSCLMLAWSTRATLRTKNCGILISRRLRGIFTNRATSSH